MTPGHSEYSESRKYKHARLSYSENNNIVIIIKGPRQYFAKALSLYLYFRCLTEAIFYLK